MEAEDDESQVVRGVGVGPRPGDEDQPEGPASAENLPARPFRRRRVLARLAIAREDPKLERHQDGGQRLGPHVAPLPVDQAQHRHHDQRGQPPGTHPACRGPEDREEGERGRPAPREQAPHAPSGPQWPDQRTEEPGIVRVHPPVGGPGPELARRDRVRLPDHAPDQEVVPEVGVIDPVADRDQHAGRSHQGRGQQGRVAERERRGGDRRGRAAGSGGMGSAHGGRTVGDGQGFRQAPGGLRR